MTTRTPTELREQAAKKRAKKRVIRHHQTGKVRLKKRRGDRSVTEIKMSMRK